jgi:outer membrane protein assembly factor BamB
MSLRLPLLAASVLFACCDTLIAADWPEFRGPNRDGICKETGLLRTWPKEGPPKIWTAKKLGQGFGTPTVADGKIFGLGTVENKDGVWALKESDGSELWFTAFDEPRKTNQNNGPSATPTYSAGKVYAVSSNGKLVCLDAAKGKKLWSVDYVADYTGKIPSWGYTDSPLVDGDKLICAPETAKATLVALNKDTGKEIWKSEVGPVGGGAGYSSPVKMTLNDTPMYVILTGDKAGVVGIHADTGKLLWQYTGKAATGGVAQIPIPIVYGDHVWVSCSYSGGSALLQIVPAGKDKFTVKEIKAYKKPELNNHHGGMVLVDGCIYFGHDQKNGNPVCVEMKTGEIKWGPEKNPAGGRGSAAVLYADGRLYFRYEDGTLVLIEPSPTELKVVSSFKLPEPSGKESWPYPVIANGKLYIRDQDKLHCFNLKADKN